MRSKRTPMMWSRLTWMLLLPFVVLPVTPAQAQSGDTPRPRILTSTQTLPSDILSSADGSLLLSDRALSAPVNLGAFQHYGSHTSAPQRLAQPTTQLTLNYRAETPAGSLVLIDVRGSSDGRRWLPWVTELAPDAVIGFAQPISYAQYRVTMMGNPAALPQVRTITLSVNYRYREPTVLSGKLDAYAIAPTFRVRATRMGMVGGRTANGWIIPPRARFVSLPSFSSLSSLNGNEYQVRLTYRGRSVVVPVYDVGPYSRRDDFWNPVRRGHPDLEWGWPVDHAAFYEGYNGGWAEKGFVRFPTAVDVGDGSWIEDLGIVGDQAELQVTFLWLGQDPANGSPMRNPELTEHVVDELSGDFWFSKPLRASAVGCGFARHAYWANSDPDLATTTVVRWQPQIPVEAAYDLFVHVPICPSRQPPLSAARYVIQHRDGVLEQVVNQREQTGWVYLGRYPFAAGRNGYVQLGALGEAGATVWFDQVKWVRVP